jgi:hypothetical protein
MKKKVLAAVGISGLLMVGGVVSASASSSGYDLFKTAVKKTHNVSSFTAHVQASLEDNGKEVYKVDSLNLVNLKDDASQSTVNIDNGGTSTNVDFYSKDNQSVVKSSKDVNYYVKQETERKSESKNEKQKEELSPAMQKDVEAIFDALTKNYQNNITTNDLGNGKTEIQLDLSKNQIPAVGQAVVSFFLKNIDQQKEQMDSNEFGSLQFSDLKPQLPQLKNNISVSSVVLKGQVDKDQYLVGQEAILSVSGVDVNGVHHDLVLHLTSSLDKLNQSTITNLDLNGKTVVNVKDDHQGRED